MGKNVAPGPVGTGMGEAERQHLDWLARSLARADYRPLRPSDIESLERVGDTVTIAPGAFLFREGEPADATYIVERGSVEIIRGAESGRRIVARAEPGSVLGDFAMFGGRNHIAGARAVEPLKAHRFTRSRLLPELAVNPGIMLRWLVATMRRIERTQQRFISLAHKPVLSRVADLLVEETERQPNVNFSQSAIGVLLGVSRQSVNESLSRLRELGVVETGYRNIEILDPDRLEEVSSMRPTGGGVGPR